MMILYVDGSQRGIAACDGPSQNSSLPFMLMCFMFVYIDRTNAIGGHKVIKTFSTNIY